MDRRAPNMIKLYKSGKSLGDIAVLYGLSRERVRQILRDEGLTRYDGGQYIQTLARQATRKAERTLRLNKRMQSMYGMDYEPLKALQAKFPHHWLSYRRCKLNCKRRKIGFFLTFEQWLNIWRDSDAWDKRERTREGYCIGRKDIGKPYIIDNVFVVRIGELKPTQEKIAHER